MKSALVTGAAGFVGRHLVPKLQNAVPAIINVRQVDHLNPDDCSLLRWLSSEEATYPFDAVIHLAANIDSIDRRVDGGIEEFADSLLDLEMLRYIERHSPKVYVHMTSCVVGYPAPEDPYCAVKTFGEAMARHVCKRGGIRLVLLRPYSGYGADQADTYPFPAILKRAMRRENPLTVWGSGDQVRDFVHVDDLVSAILHGINGGFPDGVPVEIGTGIGTSFKTLARMMADAVGYQPEIQPMPEKPEGAKIRVADVSLAERHGWKAKVTLQEGIARALRELGNIP